TFVSFLLVQFVLLMFRPRGEGLLSGRSKNVWESPLGCLLFSFTLQMEDGRIVPLAQYVVSIVITKVLKDICNKNIFPSNIFWS
ncbi:hypothetical protein HN51_012168, partial [Arachis hypogaea]